jgi:hypothetical protein
MEIEVKVTATTEVAVDVTVTPVDGRSPGPAGPRAIGSSSATILSSNASTIRSRGMAFRNPRRSACRHAFRIRDDPPCGRCEG